MRQSRIEYRLVSRNLRRPFAWIPGSPVVACLSAPRPRRCDPGCEGFDDELARELDAQAREWLRERPRQAPLMHAPLPVSLHTLRFGLICRRCRAVYFMADD